MINDFFPLQVVVLISDGLATRGGDPINTAAKLKEEGIQIFCFGVGRYIRTELESLASNLQNVFVCKGFKEFKRLARKIRGGNMHINILVSVKF